MNRNDEIAMSRRNGEVAVVTGGAQGIGFAIAMQLGLEGATIVLLDMNKDKLDEAKAKLEAQNIKTHVHSVNVTNANEVERVFDAIVSELHTITVLVCSAGITGNTNIKTHEVDVENFELVMSVNTSGIFYCCRAALKYMLKENYGRIVNIASIAGKEGNSGMLAYSTSKAAVIGMTKVIGKDYAETGITCNCIAPAVVRTQMVDNLPEEQVKYMTDKIPMKRCGKLEEIASLVSFVSSKEASFTTGFTFDATGGRATY